MIANSQKKHPGSLYTVLCYQHIIHELYSEQTNQFYKISTKKVKTIRKKSNKKAYKYHTYTIFEYAANSNKISILQIIPNIIGHRKQMPAWKSTYESFFIKKNNFITYSDCSWRVFIGEYMYLMMYTLIQELSY